MLLKILVLIASIAQVVGAAYLSIGTFEQTTRDLPVLIQPAGWAFSIWGLIYTLSFVYAIYQIIPKNDNPILAKTRAPALIGFLGSIVWLYLAGMEAPLVWLTIVVLFAMALAFTFVVTAPETSDLKTTLLSKYILLPYAAWTGIAAWVNVQALLVDQQVVTAEYNLLTNAFLFGGIIAFTLYYFRRASYNPWYGGVMVWASTGIIFANLDGGSLLFATLSGIYILVVIGLYLQKAIHRGGVL